ncbi:hypothetical protein BV898_05477 [Hypsibius exemplaris]|uniref:Uncharacterized protein n=1 Tax=Hypsibius exemplaris TaxID=2072580 RepID=A0A1W0WYZ7_HYPEX|nr:hypothetical protein BV898_05477 [Hypsibius exemplaris]
MDHSFKETGMGSSMLVNRAGANGTTTGENNHPREANHNRRSVTQPTVGGPQARQHVNLVQGVQDMADLSIFVIEFGINENNYSAMTLSVADRINYRYETLEVESPTQSRKSATFILSYADSYMMLEGRFCQRRLENINYDWIDLMWHNTTKAPIQGPQDRVWAQSTKCERKQINNQKQEYRGRVSIISDGMFPIQNYHENRPMLDLKIEGYPAKCLWTLGHVYHVSSEVIKQLGLEHLVDPFQKFQLRSATGHQVMSEGAIQLKVDTLRRQANLLVQVFRDMPDS